MNSVCYSFALCVLLLVGWASSPALSAQSMMQVDPFVAAAAPFDQLDQSALATGLLAERGNPFLSLYNYSLNLPYHDSLTLSRDGLQMAAVTAQTMACASVSSCCRRGSAGFGRTNVFVGRSRLV